MWQGEQSKPPLGKKKISKYAVASASFFGNVLSVLPFSQWAKVALRAMSVPIPEFLKMAKGWALPSSEFSEIIKILCICVRPSDHYVSDTACPSRSDHVDELCPPDSRRSCKELNNWSMHHLKQLTHGKQHPVVDYSSLASSCGAFAFFFSHLHLDRVKTWPSALTNPKHVSHLHFFQINSPKDTTVSIDYLKSCSIDTSD